MELRLFLLILVFPLIARSQSIDDYLRLSDIGEVNESAQEWLLQYEAIDINRVDSTFMVNSGWFSPQQAEALIEFREQFGVISFAYQLQQIDGFSSEDLQRLEKVLLFPDREEWKYGTKTYLLSRFEWNPTMSRGFKEGSFVGAPLRRQIRFRSQRTGNYSYGFLLESDKGEKFLTGDTPVDFYSFHYFRENRTRGMSWVIGDFSYQIGEGLLFSTAFRSGKNPVFLSLLKKPDQGFRPHTGSLEYGFFRGIGLRKTLNEKWRWDILISKRKDDAIVYKDSNGYWYESINTSGLHRMPSDLSRRRKLAIITFGSSLSRIGKNGQFGISTGVTKSGIPFRSKELNTGVLGVKKRSRISLFWNRRIGHFYFFSESAFSDNRGAAVLFGSMLNLSARTYATFIYRNYQRAFHTISGSPFGEYSSGRNEKGTYLGISHNLQHKFKLAAYIDLYSRLIPDSKNPFAGSAYEYMLLLEKELNKEGKFSLRWMDNYKSDKNKTMPISELVPERSQKMVAQWSQALDNYVEVRARLQSTLHNFAGQKSQGSLISLEMISEYKNWSVSLRTAQFSTSDFDTRQYIFERDIAYSFSVPAFQGEGLTWYILLKWKGLKNWTVWMRFAETIYLDRNVIGSGWDRISGNRKSEMKFQVRYSINR